MRDYILLYINGRRTEVRGAHAFMTLGDYLRYERQLTGTKIVCSEGDCAACTVMRATAQEPEKFEAINSCIISVGLLDCTHVVTVEGLREAGNLNPIQQSMVKNQGGQCGFCTPGFVMAITNLYEQKNTVDEKKVKNYLTGNLCRCTGYTSIIQAALDVPADRLKRLRDRYPSPEIREDLQKHRDLPVHIQDGDREFSAPVRLDDVHARVKEYSIYASSTDLGVQVNKGKIRPEKVLSLHLLKELYELSESDGVISVGAKVSLSDLQRFVEDKVPAFDEFLNIFASPQIKNVATLIGNVANASPIADTPPFLLISEAEIEVQGSGGIRRIPIEEFYLEYKKTALQEGEWISRIHFRIPPKESLVRLYKASKRRDLDISCVNVGFYADLDQQEYRISCGGVAGVPIRFTAAEKHLNGNPLSQKRFEEARAIALSEIQPLSDVRGRREFRLDLVEGYFQQFFHECLEDRC